MTSTERVRRKRALAREQGLCITCCRVQPRLGLRVCDFCQAHVNKYRRIRRKMTHSSTGLQHTAAMHEYAGDMASKHHLYAEAAREYSDALNIQTIIQADRVRVSEKLAEVLSLGNDPGAADLWYDHLLRSHLAHPGSGSSAINILMQVGRQLWVASKTEAALPVLSQALRIAERLGDIQILKKVRIKTANLLNQLARYEEAETLLNEVGEITDEDDMAIRVMYWTHKGLTESALGREENAFESADRAVRALREDLDAYNVTVVWSHYAIISMTLGRTELAKTCYERALLIARRNNIIWRISHLCLEYAQILMRMGQHTLAHEYLIEAISYDVKAPILDEIFGVVGIPLALHTKDAALLAKCARPHVIELAFLSAEPERIGSIAAPFARLYIEQGHHRKAQALLHRAVDAMHNILDAWDLPLEIARNGTASDIPRARRLLEARAALPCAELANAHLRLFDAFIAQRRRGYDEACAFARDAVNRFEALQWNSYADIARSILPAEQRLSDSELRHQKPFSDAYTALSKREREVAELVLRGLTNRTIASELSITENTVEKHMTSIMHRLGVRSRYQLMDRTVSKRRVGYEIERTSGFRDALEAVF